MKRLKEDFKRILIGLAYQNAGDFLSRKEKIEVLGGHSVKQNVQIPVISVASVQKVDATDNVATEILKQSAA